MYKAPRYAAAHLWALPVERLYSVAAPAIVEPTCVKQSERGRMVLTHVNTTAFAAGVLPKMSLVEAKARLPELSVRDRNPVEERRALGAAAETLLVLSPHLEVVPDDGLIIEIGGSSEVLRRMGLLDEEQVAERIREILYAFGHDATVAIASDPETAYLLARARAEERLLAQPKRRPSRRASVRPQRRKTRQKKEELSPVVVAPPEQARAILGTLPLEALLWTDPREDPDGTMDVRLRSTYASLRILGVRSVGELATFPEAQVKSRFGDAGVLLMDRALAKRQRPLRPFSLDDKIVESFELEHPIEGLEPVVFILKRLLDRLEARLYARGRAASSLRMSFVTEPTRRREQLTVSLARPSRSSGTMLRLAKEKVSGALSGPISQISIRVVPVADHGAQLDLFAKHEERVEKVEELIDRLKASLGDQAVFAAELVSSHRPEAAWTQRRFEADRALREVEVPARGKKRAPDKLAHLVRTLPRESFALPSTKAALSVIDQTQTEGSLALKSTQLEPKRWPKPVKPKLEEMPLPALPPRPLELFEAPEPAQLSKDRLWFRGRHHEIVDISSKEELEAEWWTSAPLHRQYMTVSLADGRRLWLFREPTGQTWVHGAFD